MFPNLSNIIINLSYDGQNFHPHGNSSIHHYGTSLANSNGAPFVVGGSSPRTNEADQFDISTNTWVRVDAYFFSDLYVTVFFMAQIITSLFYTNFKYIQLWNWNNDEKWSNYCWWKHFRWRRR